MNLTSPLIVFLTLIACSLASYEAFNQPSRNIVIKYLNTQWDEVKHNFVGSDVEKVIVKGKRYHCVLPDPPEVQWHTKSETITQERLTTIFSNIHSWQGNQELPCLNLTNDWQSFEVCPGESVSQESTSREATKSRLQDLAEKGGKKGDVASPQRDDKFSLGKYSVAKNRELSESVHSNPIATNYQYLSEFYDEGDLCYETKKPRNAEVRYICNPEEDGVLASSQEHLICSYIFFIETSAICGILDPQTKVKNNNIICYPDKAEKPHSVSLTIHDQKITLGEHTYPIISPEEAFKKAVAESFDNLKEEGKLINESKKTTSDYSSEDSRSRADEARKKYNLEKDIQAPGAVVEDHETHTIVKRPGKSEAFGSILKETKRKILDTMGTSFVGKKGWKASPRDPSDLAPLPDANQGFPAMPAEQRARFKSCIHHSQGWQKIELCYGKYVKQYQVKNGKKTAAVLLGSAISPPLAINYDLVNPPQDDKWQNALHRPYEPFYIERYDNGDKCGATGEPRTCDVRYVCAHNGRTNILDISETSICHYTITVATPIVCSDPLLSTSLHSEEQ